MLIAQITDLHIRPRGKPAYRVAETNTLSERAIEALLACDPRPDAVLISGDLTDCGLPEEYAVLSELLHRLPMPVYAVPGNHDRRENFRAQLGHLAGVAADPEFVHFAIEDHPLRLVGLDTVIPGGSDGALCARRLAWLETTLALAPAKPTLIFMHHPPFDCGVASMDRIRLVEGAEALESIVEKNPQIVALVAGHHHRAIETQFGGRPCSVAPGVAHQVLLSFRPDRPAGLVMEPPAYRLLRWNRGRLVSHTAYVETFPGPFPFVLDADYPGGAD